MSLKRATLRSQNIHTLLRVDVCVCVCMLVVLCIYLSCDLRAASSSTRTSRLIRVFNFVFQKISIQKMLVNISHYAARWRLFISMFCFFFFEIKKIPAFISHSASNTYTRKKYISINIFLAARRLSNSQHFFFFFFWLFEKCSASQWKPKNHIFGSFCFYRPH